MPLAELVEVASEDVSQVSRWRRLMAALLDGLLVVLAWAVVEGVANLLGTSVLSDDGSEAKVSSLEFLRDLLVEPTSPMDACVGFGIFLLMQGYLLAKRQQTIGKIALGLRIVRADGRPAGTTRILAVREAFVWLLGVLPWGNLVLLLDPVFIFRRDRRCLHDLIAGTRVISAKARMPKVAANDAT